MLLLLQVCGAQAISGTGSLRLGMQFLRKFYASEVVYVSKPTWGEYEVISNSNTCLKLSLTISKGDFKCYSHACILLL